MLPIRELKRRYKTNLALHQVLPLADMATALPLSTGHPLYDAALTDKLVVTATMTEADHLGRAWHLIQKATTADLTILGQHASLLLNDYKLLLALRAWNEGQEELTRTFLGALPWHWRLGFPIAVLKPAEHLFTGWRKSLTFRLIDEPRYPALRQLFRELLAQAPPIALLKYRQTVKSAAALQRFRFETEREKIIHDLCFHKGKHVSETGLEPIGTYLQARQAILGGDVKTFLTILDAAAHEIPLTSYMGLLGNAGIRLQDNNHPHKTALRRHAIRSASAIESLLRLKEWSPWLEAEHAAALGEKVRHAVIGRGLNIPFFKVVKGFIAAPPNVRQLVLEPLLLPLLSHFGGQVAGLLPEPTPLTYLQPANVVHLMSFLLYTVLSQAMPTRFFLMYPDGAEEVPPLDLAEVSHHLADAPETMQQWLLQQFGGLITHRDYTYNYGQIAATFQELNPAAPLLLDLPFANSPDLIAALLPFERVFNLNTTFGAPGEVCLAYEYYAQFRLDMPGWSYSIWSRYSDAAAQRFAEFLERLRAFQTLGAAFDTPRG